MANYSVELTRQAERQLTNAPKADRQRLIAALQMLAMTPWPNGCRKLSGYNNLFRVRVGSYRIIYEIIEARIVIRVLKIGHRKDVYRAL